MDARRWDNGAAVRREDQFTQAPEFFDEHDSRHLPMWERVAASWHGMTAGRRIVMTASIGIMAIAAGALVVFTAQDFGVGEGSDGASPGGPLGAQDAGQDPGQALPTDNPAGLLNETLPGPSSSSLPSAPVLS